MTFLRRFTWLSISIFLLTFCSSPEPSDPVDPAFTGYVAAFTSGVVSNQAQVRIKLAEPYSAAQVNQPVAKKLFDFKPNIEGNASWEDQRTIVFRPTQKLPSGKLIQVNFHLHKLMEVPDKLETMTFDLSVMKQSLQVTFKGMHSYSESDLSWQKVEGTALTYDFAEAENVENAVSITQNGKNLSVRWQHDSNGKTHSFTIDSVARTEKPSQVILQWAGETLDMDQNGEETFTVPSVNDFSVLSMESESDPNQVVTVHFSDPLEPSQNFDGMVYLANGSPVKLVHDRNAIKAYPQQSLRGTQEVIVSAGIKNGGGFSLGSAFRQKVTFQDLHPAVEFLGEGQIVPTQGRLRVPFRAVNLSAVTVRVIQIFEENVPQFLQVNQIDGERELKRSGRLVYKGEVRLQSQKAIDYAQWNNFELDLSKFMKAEPGAIYRVMLSFNPYQSLYPCAAEWPEEYRSFFEDNTEEQDFYDKPSSRSYYYGGSYSQNYRQYNYRERDNPCKLSYYLNSSHSVVKNVLASNFGIIAKGGANGEIRLAVTDLKTVKPLKDIEVEIRNLQNQVIQKATTNADGFATLQVEQKPFLAVAKRAGERGYLRLDDGSALSLSMFNVGGQRLHQGVNGIIYGERGVWRPGDSLFLTFVLRDRQQTLPAGHPVVMELYNPQQQMEKRLVTHQGKNGFYSFKTKTSRNAPTGTWRAKVKVGGSEFERSLRIETVKPNRLKVHLDFEHEILTSEVREATLSSRWLHGAPAPGLKADVELSLSAGSTQFDRYPDYQFDDPSREYYGSEQMIFEGNLNEESQAQVPLEWEIDQDQAPGMLNASFKVRVFEKGGDFSVNRMQKKYSPYKGYVGVKVPEGKGWNGALYSNESHLIPIAAVNEEGQPVTRRKVKVEVYSVSWRWWWEQSGDRNLSRYVRNKNAYLIQEGTVDVINGEGNYELKFDRNYYGRKFIRVIDPETGHSAGQSFYVTYRGWWDNSNGSSPGGAEMLTFNTSKDQYAVGETVQVEVPSAREGRILVSIESGSKIVKTYWHELREDANTIEFEATSAMAPNVYVHLSLLQPHDQVHNDRPLRLYGVQPVSIENPDTRLEPQIEMPPKLAPEEKFTVRVSEKENREMTYTLAVVDDGLLDLTHYKTPYLWSHFYAKQALRIHTWDMYKYVMGAYTGKMAGLLAVGGDDYIAKSGGSKANRFKPVVMYKGPFTLKKGSNEHTFTMPNYVGSVRVMVVAGQDGAYGSNEKSVPVKKPLMALATLPRVAGPGETLELPVTLFAMEPTVKNVKVQLQTNGLLTSADGVTTQKVTFTEVGDKVVRFKLKAAQKLGVATVNIVATSGSKRATYQVEMDVRASNPRITEVQDTLLRGGQSLSMQYTPVGMQGTNRATLEVSALPALHLEKRLQFLIRYPHGCIEQTTSSVFPQLFLSKLLEMEPAQKSEIEQNVRAALNRYLKFQTAAGGFAYWPGNSGANEWGTNYAGHFMLEAQKLGYTLPSGMLKRWTDFQIRQANGHRAETDGYGSVRAHQLVQAYRLYVLALAGKPQLGAMNRLRNSGNLSLPAQWRLAAAYAQAGKSSVAHALIENLSTEAKPYQGMHGTYGSSLRDQAMILETLTLLDKSAQAASVMKEIAHQMGSSQWYSTQTTAYALMAIAKYSGGYASAQSLNYSWQAGTKKQQVQLTAPISKHNIATHDKEEQVTLENNGDKPLYVTLSSSGIPASEPVSDKADNLGMEVQYLNLQGEAIAVKELTRGTDFMAKVTLSHPGVRDEYQEMALTQIVPSGWEIRNMRMDKGFEGMEESAYDYRDIRDDRVLTYFDLKRNESRTFYILLHAAYQGRFYLPTVYAEAMYDAEIFARKGGQWVEVTAPGN